MTINEALSLAKVVRERVGSLRKMREQVSTKEHYFSGTEKSREPTYDVKAVDAKITELELFLFQIDAKIKQSNAVTQINVQADPAILLSPLV